MFDHLEKAYNYSMNQGAEFVFIRGESINLTNIRFEDGRVESISKRSEHGFTVSVVFNGAFGFASGSNFENVIAVADKALKLAKSLSKYQESKIKIQELEPVKIKLDGSLAFDPTSIPTEEKVYYLREIYRNAIDLDDRINAITSEYVDTKKANYIVTSDGSEIEESISYLLSEFRVNARSGNRNTSIKTKTGNRGYSWKEFIHLESPEKIAQDIIKKVKNQLEGKNAKSGEYPMVLGPLIMGVLAHESIGHLIEADNTIKSPLNGRIGTKITNENVSLIDDGTLKGGFGTASYSDLGAKTQKVRIINKGVLETLLTDRKIASNFDMPLTGNGRSQDFRYPPMVRMRNTYIEPGDYELEELFEGIDFGYYIVDYRAGHANLNSNFQITIQEAYEIVRGEIGSPVRDLSIDGFGLEALSGIEMLSKDFQMHPARCSKRRQMVYVSLGGPYARLKKGSIHVTAESNGA